MNCEKKIRGILIDPKEGMRVTEADLSSVESVHALLRCRCYAMVGRDILGDGGELTVLHDDEFLLKDDVVDEGPSIISVDGATGKMVEAFFGPVFICDYDWDENHERSLTAEQAIRVLSKANLIEWRGKRLETLIFVYTKEDC